MFGSESSMFLFFVFLGMMFELDHYKNPFITNRNHCLPVKQNYRHVASVTNIYPKLPLVHRNFGAQYGDAAVIHIFVSSI